MNEIAENRIKQIKASVKAFEGAFKKLGNTAIDLKAGKEVMEEANT